MYPNHLNLNVFDFHIVREIKYKRIKCGCIADSVVVALTCVAHISNKDNGVFKNQCGLPSGTKYA